jgi:DNA replication protein DnaC
MTKMTDTAAAAAIGAATRELRLPVVRTDAARLAEIAQRSQQSYLAFLAEILSAEVDERIERRRQRRIHEARFPRTKRLADFDLDAAPTINPATIATLASGAYLDAGEPVVLLGDSGTGKPHLVIGLGIAACEQGRRVRYATAAQLVNELAEAADERRLSRIVARYGRLDLLCLDELAFIQLDARGSEPLFQILTEREEKASVALASNLPLSEWGTVIPDPPPSRRHRRPRHLQRPHPRDRHQQLPPPHHPHPDPPQDRLNTHQTLTGGDCPTLRCQTVTACGLTRP